MNEPTWFTFNGCRSFLWDSCIQVKKVFSLFHLFMQINDCMRDKGNLDNDVRAMYEIYFYKLEFFAIVIQW